MDDNTLNNTNTIGEEESPLTENDTAAGNGSPNVHEQDAETDSDHLVNAILDRLGVSPNTAAAAKAIIETIKTAKSPNENFVRLIVNALKHDEDIKNAEAAGYIRGRNEVIDEACNNNAKQDAKPVNFPIYRKRSFWD